MADAADPAGVFIDACVDDLDKARRLFEADPQVLYLTMVGSPMLHWFVIEDFQIAVQRTLEVFKVDVHHRNDCGETAIHAACMSGRLGSLRLLIKHGADLDAFHGVLDEPPLQLAIRHQHLDVALQLMESGAKLDYLIDDFTTVLHAVAGLPQSNKSTMTNALAKRGITRESLFESLKLGDEFDSVEDFFDS